MGRKRSSIISSGGVCFRFAQAAICHLSRGPLSPRNKAFGRHTHQRLPEKSVTLRLSLANDSPVTSSIFESLKAAVYDRSSLDVEAHVNKDEWAEVDNRLHLLT